MDYYTYFCFNLVLTVLMDEFSISRHRFFQMSIYLEIFTKSYVKSQEIGMRFSDFAEKAAPGLRHYVYIIKGRI